MKIIFSILSFSLLFFLFSCSSSKYDIDPSTINDVREFSENYAAFRSGELWGYINSIGECVIKPQFHDASGFSEKLASVKLNNKWGFINTSGVYEINPQYDDAKDFSEKFAPVKKDNAWGYIDKKGILVIDYQFEDANDFSGELASVKMGGKWGFINKAGQYQVNPLYDGAGSFFEDIAPVKSDKAGGKWGYIDKHGQYIIEPQYDGAQSFNYINSSTRPALAAVMMDGEWGFIDTKGRNVINPQFEDVLPFSEGLAPIKSSGQWGFIDGNGKSIISPQFIEAGCLQSGYCLVNKDGNKFFIDKKGTDADVITVSSGLEVGKFRPPDKRLDCQGTDYPPRSLELNFYNFSKDTMEMRAYQMDRSDSAAFDGIKIPPMAFYMPKHQVTHFNGFLQIYIAKKYYCDVWFFTYGGIGKSMVCSFTLIPRPQGDIEYADRYTSSDYTMPYRALFYSVDGYRIFVQNYNHNFPPGNCLIESVNFSLIVENTDNPVIPGYYK